MMLIRAAALGAAAGARSATPLAALALRRHDVVGKFALAAALGEIVVDKLPGTPSRLKPAPLAGRVLSGALSAAGYARSQGDSVVLPAVVGAASAYAASYAGAAWREYASRRSLAVPAALAEDAIATLLASGATRSRPAFIRRSGR